MAYPQSGPPHGAPYGGPQYGAPYGGGYGPPQVEHPQGTTILILGICSLVVCAVCGPFAWSMGNKAKADVDAAPGRYSNESLIAIGRILGIIASVLLIIQLLAVVAYIAFAIILVSSSSTGA